MSLIEANRSLKTRESCPLGRGRIEKRSVFHRPNRKDKEEACQAVPGEQRKRKTRGKLFPSKLDWSTNDKGGDRCQYHGLLGEGKGQG